MLGASVLQQPTLHSHRSAGRRDEQSRSGSITPVLRAGARQSGGLIGHHHDLVATVMRQSSATSSIGP